MQNNKNKQKGAKMKKLKNVLLWYSLFYVIFSLISIIPGFFNFDNFIEQFRESGIGGLVVSFLMILPLAFYLTLNIFEEAKNKRDDLVNDTLKNKTSKIEPYDNRKGLYYVPVWKFALLNLATLGVFSVYWGYRQWKFLRDSGKNSQAVPWLAGLFLPFTLYSLLKSFTQLDGEEELTTKKKMVFGAAVVAYIMLNSVGTLEGIFFLISLFSFVVLFYPLKIVNGYFLKLDKNVANIPKIPWWKWLLIVLGLIFALIVLFFNFVSEEQLENVLPSDIEVESVS